MRLSDLFEDETQFTWVVPYNGNTVRNGSEKVVWIDPVKLDASFAKDPTFYVGPGGTGEGVIKGRYPRFNDWVAANDGKNIMMPEVCLGARNEITFSNGRHRYAWMRDHGVRKMLMLVPVNQADEIEKRFGA